MNRYQMATLVDWAGTLRARKRIQKVVYLLQAAGCDFGTEFTLHHFGPYSTDVARLTDEMVQVGLLEETEIPTSNGRSFEYQLSGRAADQLKQSRQSGTNRERLGPLSTYELTTRSLLDESDLRKLEFAATITYFRKELSEKNWELARIAAAEFKKQDPAGSEMKLAEEFARQIVNQE